MTVLEWPSLSTQRDFCFQSGHYWSGCSLYWKTRNLSHQVTRGTLCYFVCVGGGLWIPGISQADLFVHVQYECIILKIRHPFYVYNESVCFPWWLKHHVNLSIFLFFCTPPPLSHHFPNKHLVFMKQKQNASFLRRWPFLCFSVITVLWGRHWMQRHRQNDSKCAHPASYITYYFRHRNCNYEFKNASICLAILGLTNVKGEKSPAQGRCMKMVQVFSIMHMFREW